jgi:hypothetical protein
MGCIIAHITGTAKGSLVKQYMAMYSTGLGDDLAANFPLLILKFLSPFLFFPACLDQS